MCLCSEGRDGEYHGLQLGNMVHLCVCACLFLAWKKLFLANHHQFMYPVKRQWDFGACNCFPNSISQKKNNGRQNLNYPARALRALGLLLYSRIPQWEGGRLFDGSTKYFYRNCCNSGTESRKIVPKVGN